MNNVSDNLKEKLEELNININNHTIQDLITRVLHLIPALIKDGHCISFGKPGVGKTTLLSKSTLKIKNATKMSSASFFGNLKKTTQEIPYCSNENEVIFIEQASYLSKIDEELMNNILTHCNGDEVKRVENILNDERTSLVLLGNYNDETFKYNISENKFCLEKYIENLPCEIKAKQGLERFIILPSFLLEKLSSNSFIKYSESKNLNLERINFIEYDYLKETENIRIYKQKCKIVTALNYLLNNSEEYRNSYIFEGFKAIADSITNLINDTYRPFYKELPGKLLLLDLIKIYFSEDKKLEEAYVFNHRILLKFKEEDIWYKLALDSIGIEENQIEYVFFNNYKEKIEQIANIISLENNGIILKQEYYKLQSDYYKVSISSYNDNFNKDLLIESLNLEVKELKEELSFLKNITKELIEKFNEYIDYGYKNKIKDYFIELNPKNEILNSSLLNFNELKINEKVLKKSDIGLKNNTYKLVNFIDYIKKSKGDKVENKR